MMYPEYFYLEQLYRWLSGVAPLVVIGFALAVIALCCTQSLNPESEKEVEE